MNKPTAPVEHLLLLAGDFTRHNDALTRLHVPVRCRERTAIPPGLHFRIPWITVSLLDIPDVFIGSTDDGHTFVILNRRIRDADRLLTDAGFLPREHHGRRLYLLPPGIAQDVHERAGVAMHALLAHSHDLVDLSWTTRWSPDQPAGGPDLRFQFGDGTVAVTASTTAARLLLEQYGFVPTADGASYRPRDGLDERGLLGAVTAAEAHAYVHGLSARVGLGIPTPADFPASARRRSAAATGPRTTPSARRRTR
ncbi:hypothetical protein [Streptomyces sp. NPDC017230]|uniref:hypothetical protein n=1 Tax=unclassified Streptomyces TaxID=2593676 RepID=UPI0037A71D7D